MAHKTKCKVKAVYEPWKRQLKRCSPTKPISYSIAFFWLKSFAAKGIAWFVDRLVRLIVLDFRENLLLRTAKTEWFFSSSFIQMQMRGVVVHTKTAFSPISCRIFESGATDLDAAKVIINPKIHMNMNEAAFNHHQSKWYRTTELNCRRTFFLSSAFPSEQVRALQMISSFSRLKCSYFFGSIFIWWFALNTPCNRQLNDVKSDRRHRPTKETANGHHCDELCSLAHGALDETKPRSDDNSMKCGKRKQETSIINTFCWWNDSFCAFVSPDKSKWNEQPVESQIIELDQRSFNPPRSIQVLRFVCAVRGGTQQSSYPLSAYYNAATNKQLLILWIKCKCTSSSLISHRFSAQANCTHVRSKVK